MKINKKRGVRRLFLVALVLAVCSSVSIFWDRYRSRLSSISRDSRSLTMESLGVEVVACALPNKFLSMPDILINLLCNNLSG